MLENILDLSIFSTVVAEGSMSGAARKLDLSLAVVSKRLAALEQRIGVRLLNRTTRQQSLTQEGSIFHAHCVRILAEVNDAELDLHDSRENVSGVLRVTAPGVFGRLYLAKIVAGFQVAHPSLRVQIELRDDIVDLVRSGIDVALRFGALHDSGMTARFVAPNYRVLCASPSYVTRFGAPVHPADLRQHQCIIYGERPSSHWLFQHKNKPLAVEVHGTFRCNEGGAAQALALEGAGILFKSIWDVGPDIAAGRLVPVMPKYTAATEPLHIVYPHALHLTPRVRQFVRYALEQLQVEQHWDKAYSAANQSETHATDIVSR